MRPWSGRSFLFFLMGCLVVTTIAAQLKVFCGTLVHSRVLQDYLIGFDMGSVSLV